MYCINANKLTFSSIFEKFEVLHVFDTGEDKDSKIDSKLVLLDRFLDLVNVLVSIDFLLAK